MSETWVEIQIETAAQGADLVAAAVIPIAGGVELRDCETVFPTALDRTVVVALCRPNDAEALLQAVDEALAVARASGAGVDPVQIRRRLAHEDEWRDVWKQFFRATRVGRRFTVRPSWDPGAAAPGEHVIDLDPGRAFGTGAHPSTRLVIGFVEELFERRPTLARFLDLGCGSGILSIVAARLWPRTQGVAVDCDEEATECSLENFARNGITSVGVKMGTLADAPGAFDLVMANIQADVLQTIAAHVGSHMSRGGTLVLSGLLGQDVPAVRAAYDRGGLQFEARADEGEWAALLYVRPT